MRKTIIVAFVAGLSSFFLMNFSCGPQVCLKADEVVSLCTTHGFGPAIKCGPERRPQTTEKCEEVLDQNPGVCAGEYIMCRDALRVARCGQCPEECLGFDGLEEYGCVSEQTPTPDPTTTSG